VLMLPRRMGILDQKMGSRADWDPIF
jgi:hypothetical protein